MPRARLRSRVAPTLALVAGLAATLCACGTTTTVGANHSLAIGLTEYRLSPQKAQASAGELSLYVRNRGRLTHNLAVTGAGQTVAATKPIRPGQSAWLYLDLAPGSYTMASTMFSDQALGQYGTLVVH